jgi:hypothetical protein
MNYFMGNFGEMTDPNDGGKTIVSTGIQLATSSVDRSLENISKLAKTEQVEQFIRENNLGPYMKDITKDNVKTILAFFGMYTIYKFIKSPVGIAILAGTAIYVMSSTDISKLTEKMINAPAPAPAPSPSLASAPVSEQNPGLILKQEASSENITA